MKMQKKVNVGGDWAKVGVDIKDQDVITILDEGQTVVGEYGDRDVFQVELASGEKKNLSFNQTSVNNLVDGLGDESTTWVGKKIKAWVIRALVSGKMRNIAYLAPEGWEMNIDDKGNVVFVNPTATSKETPSGEGEVNPEDIPF
tara:strand:- start:1012 stop:1443 length:432 start_codon:yes stop_codon:yes gene_type:complete